MAYILSGHLQAGPFPHKEGEFVGNYRKDEKDGATGWFDPKRHRLGRPRPAQPGQIVSKLEADGWQGKYLLEDDNAQRGITPFFNNRLLDGRVVLVEQSVADGSPRWVAVNPQDEDIVNKWYTELKRAGREPNNLSEPDADEVY